MDKCSTTSLSTFPRYILTLLDIQASRQGKKKQTLTEEAVEYGLRYFYEKRKAQIDRLERAKNVLFEEAAHPQKVRKIFSGNDLTLSNGPDVEDNKKMGFARRRTVRLSASLEEDVTKLSDLLGISRTFLIGIFTSHYLLSCEKVGVEWKIPMAKDIKSFLLRVGEIEGEVKEIIKRERGGKREGEDFGLEDVYKG